MVSQSSETKTAREAPVRAPSAVPVDDTVLPFEVNALDLRGRLTRLGPALDLYSVGVIAFEMITGKLPFLGGSVVEVLLKHAQEPPVRPSSLLMRMRKMR